MPDEAASFSALNLSVKKDALRTIRTWMLKQSDYGAAEAVQMSRLRVLPER